MKIVARQWRWMIILRVAIGFGVVAVGLVLPWFPVVDGIRTNNWANLRVLRLLIPAGLAFCLSGGYFAYYARLEWRPRGIVVGLCRHGLVCKVNSVRRPRLLVIEWFNVERAVFEPPRWFGLRGGKVRVILRMSLPEGTLPKARSGVVQAGACSIVLGGWWDLWHPKDVADLIQAAATDQAVRDSLGERREDLYP